MMHLSNRFVLVLLLALFALSGCGYTGAAGTKRNIYYVDAEKGNDGNHGQARGDAFKTIQRAAEIVKAGDEVVVLPGIYIESVEIRAQGKPDKPITFRADDLRKGKVIVSGADAGVRSGANKWEVVNREKNVYAVRLPERNFEKNAELKHDPVNGKNDTPYPYKELADNFPARVLYDNVDLYPYSTLAGLESLQLEMGFGKRKKVGPGPMHGYVWDEKSKTLYVRLHSEGKYGSLNPGDHVMTIAPPTGAGFAGVTVSRKHHYNFGVLAEGKPAYVVIDGFTLETPGVCGVYVDASNVTVRNCSFSGCRSGVGGTADEEHYYNGYKGCANKIEIQNCAFTQYPLYEDAVECYEKTSKLGWQRKHEGNGLPSCRLMYEIGIASRIGLGWDVHNNHIYDAFEGLSMHAVNWSKGLRVHENLFEKLLDNAIETEDHSREMHFYRNVIRDTFSPISWQPLRHKPWPEHFYCYQNIVYGTPQHWKYFSFRKPQVFKIGATNAHKVYGKDYLPVPLPGEGLLIFNNTIYWPEGLAFWPAVWGNGPDKFKLYNNIIVTQFNTRKKWLQDTPSYLTFAGNLCVNTNGVPVKDEFASQVVPDVASLKLTDPEKANFMPMATSPAVNKAVPVSGAAVMQLKDIGALQQGDHWYPLSVGPEVSNDEKK